MNREIKFRGLDYTGVWRIGNLILTENMENAKAGILISRKMDDESYVETTYILDPDTVGQFTGLRDSNGAEIYEGDILDLNEMGRVEVIFEDGMFGANADGYGILPLRSTLFGEGGVVIGNIHDNPELLEGKK